MRIPVELDPVEIYRLVVLDADEFSPEQLAAMHVAIETELERLAKHNEQDRLSDLAKASERAA